MPNEIGPHLEQRIIAFSLAHAGFGPRRISAELAREKWGGLRISEHGVWRVLCRVGLNTRGKRLALIARHRDPTSEHPHRHPPSGASTPQSPGSSCRPTASSSAAYPAAKGRSGNTPAIDVASGYTWAELHSSERNPRSRHCQALVHRLAHELGQAGWKLQTVTTDNGSEFVNKDFGKVVQAAGGRQRRIKAGRPTSNGCVERVQLTILEQCWRPSFARSLVPKLTALKRDLDEYLAYYNTDRAHTGRHTQGRVPAEIVYGARKMAAAMTCRVHSGLAQPRGRASLLPS